MRPPFSKDLLFGVADLLSHPLSKIKSVRRTDGNYRESDQTRIDPRFVGDGFETLVYLVDEGAYYQTTFAYSRQLLSARAEQIGLEPATPPHPTDTTADLGTGVTTDEEATLTVKPLLDVWTATGAGE